MERPVIGSIHDAEGLRENLLPVLGHILAQLRRRLIPRSVPLATRPEEVAVVTTGLRRSQPRRLDRYLDLTDGTDLKPGLERTMPPLYPTVWGLEPWLELLGDPRLDLSLLGLVHAQNDLISLRPIALSDPQTMSLSIERLHRDDRRALLTVLCQIAVRGAVCTESRSVLVTGVSPSETSRESSLTVPDLGLWTTIRRLELDRYHGLRYALFSGDVNPLHLHRWSSRWYGFDGPILHGICLKSIVAHALIRSVGQGRVGALRRLRLRFRAPVFLPSSLWIQTTENRVRVVSPKDGTLLADGRYRVGDTQVT